MKQFAVSLSSLCLIFETVACSPGYNNGDASYSSANTVYSATSGIAGYATMVIGCGTVPVYPYTNTTCADPQPVSLSFDISKCESPSTNCAPVKTVASDALGQFQVNVDPGYYLITLHQSTLPPGVLTYRPAETLTPIPVIVLANQQLRVDINVINNMPVP